MVLILRNFVFHEDTLFKVNIRIFFFSERENWLVDLRNGNFSFRCCFSQKKILRKDNLECPCTYFSHAYCSANIQLVNQTISKLRIGRKLGAHSLQLFQSFSCLCFVYISRDDFTFFFAAEYHVIVLWQTKIFSSTPFHPSQAPNSSRFPTESTLWEMCPVSLWIIYSFLFFFLCR